MNSFGTFPNPLERGKKQVLRGLLAEDSPPDRFLVKKYLSECPNFAFDMVEVDSVKDAVAELSNSRFDFVLLDLRLRDGQGSEVLERMGTEFPPFPTIVLTGFDQVDVAISAMRHGAQDYLPKDNLNSEVLSRAIWYAIERHKVLEKLAFAKEQVEAADRAKTEFLANMSHEMRTPLSVILASVDVLVCEQAEISPGVASSMEMIRRNSQHLLSLVDGLLDVSRLELGALPTRPKVFNLERELASTLQSLELVASRKGIDFTVDNSEVHKQDVATDPMRLAQILFNVVGNAIKFTDSGSVNVKIFVPAAPATLIKFTVTDTGPGILPEHTNLLFKPFFQGDTSPSRRHGGAGLGLALTKRIAKTLGGDIRLVESAPGKGTTFEITLADKPDVPQKNAPASGPSVYVQPEAGKQVVPKILDGVRVLVVEDCEDNQRIAKFFLEGAGASVSIADNATDGILAVEKKRFDIILMDIQMPGLDGYGATRELRNRGYSLPIVAVTAHAMQDEKEKCLAAGCDDYISKPYQYQIFLKKLASLASRSPRTEGSKASSLS